MNLRRSGREHGTQTEVAGGDKIHGSFGDGSPCPDLVKTVPHVAFEVDDLAEAIRNRNVIIAPNSPSAGVLVAFIEVNGAPVELMQIDHSLRKDL